MEKKSQCGRRKAIAPDPLPYAHRASDGSFWTNVDLLDFIVEVQLQFVTDTVFPYFLPSRDTP
jgi:hypothetical protein